VPLHAMATSSTQPARRSAVWTRLLVQFRRRLELVMVFYLSRFVVRKNRPHCSRRVMLQRRRGGHLRSRSRSGTVTLVDPPRNSPSVAHGLCLLTLTRFSHCALICDMDGRVFFKCVSQHLNTPGAGYPPHT
jgi:hypothetical protein